MLFQECRKRKRNDEAWDDFPAELEKEFEKFEKEEAQAAAKMAATKKKRSAICELECLKMIMVGSTRKILVAMLIPING